MRKKILAGMLAALMAVSMLTGCSGRPDNAKNNSAADDSKKKTEKVELTVWAGAEDREYFDHIFSHSAVRSIWRQCIRRVTESKRIGADMAIKRKK